MATEVIAAPLGAIRAAYAATATSATAGGTQATTTAKVWMLPPGTAWLGLVARNFSTAVVLRFALNPYLAVVKTTDALATGTNATDYSENAQDAAAGTLVTLSSLDTAANNGYLYLGAARQFRGFYADVVSPNSNAATTAADYRKSDNTWAALSITDGTANAGATFAQDGAYTWTMPTDWITSKLTVSASAVSAVPYSGADLYWVRLKVSAALDSSTTLASLHALSSSTDYAELIDSQPFETRVSRGVGGIGCVEALTDAGTCSLIVNVATASPRGFV